MASSSGHALDSKQIHEQLHDSDSSSEFSQDSDIDIFDLTDPDAETRGADLRDSCSNSDANVGGGGGCSGGYKDEDDDNEDWALWDENDHDFYMIFLASSGHEPPQTGKMPVSPHDL
jgi:hypothetical protein